MSGAPAGGAGRVLLVEEGESRISLAGSRALAAAGWTVGIGAPSRSHASTSRTSQALHRVPLANDGLGAFLDGVRQAVRAGGYDVVLGVGDPEVLALSAHRDALGAPVPYPDHDVLLRVVDKARLAGPAARAGLRTPREFPLDGLADRPGPFFVKPDLNGRVGHVGTSKISAVGVPDGRAALAAAARVREQGAEPIVQEVVQGRLMALALLLAPDGRTVAACQQHATRTYLPDAGVSCRAETTPVDEVLADRAAELLRGLGWWGLTQLQFVAGPTGPPVLIDVNARLYGSVSLSFAAGVNLPALWLRLARGGAVPERVQAAVGVRYQWLEGDLRRAVLQREGGLARDVVSTLAAALTSHHSTWSPADPLPGLRQVARLGGRAVRKAARTRR